MMRLFVFNSDVGLLLARIGFGSMMFLGHGLKKINSIMEMGLEAPFGDPLGIGHDLSLVSATTAETLCALFVILGFQTRLSALALAFTMAVAGFIAHANDPFFFAFVTNVSPEYPYLWRPFKELALLYGVAFLALVFTGPGCYSLDARLRR